MFEDFFKGFSGVLGSVGGAFVNNWLTQRGDRMRMEYAKELSDRSYNQALDFWNRQNAYNTPKAQMERFKEAGLNPHLIYGQTNMASPVPSADVAKADIKGPHLEGLMAYQNLKNLRSQNDLIQAQKDLAVAQAANTRTITSQLPDQLKIAFGQLQNSMESTDIARQNANTAAGRLSLDVRSLEANPQVLVTEFLKELVSDPDAAFAKFEPIFQKLGSLLSIPSFEISKSLRTIAGEVSQSSPQDVAALIMDLLPGVGQVRAVSKLGKLGKSIFQLMGRFRHANDNSKGFHPANRR